MSDLILIDGLLADEETGEVVEWPEGAPGDGPERIAFLVNAARGVQQAEKDSKLAYDTYRRVIGRLLGDTAALSTDYGRAVKVKAGETKTAHAAKVTDAIEAELLSEEEAVDLLIRAAKELDPARVEDWIDSQEYDPEAAACIKAMLRALLITKSPRASYVRIYPPAARPPRVERRARDLTPALQESIDRLEAERMAH